MSDPDEWIPLILEMLYPNSWLDQVNAEDAEGQTNRSLLTKVSLILPSRWGPVQSLA